METGLAITSEHNVARWLRPQDIVLDVDVWDRRGALELAATRIGQANGLDPAPILRALWRREKIGSTAIGQGVAVPHARISGITRPLTLFMRPKIAMEFEAPDGKPVSNLLFIMVPVDGATNDHLQLLAQVARAFSDPGFRSRLSMASTKEDAAAVFDQWAQQLPV